MGATPAQGERGATRGWIQAQPQLWEPTENSKAQAPGEKHQANACRFANNTEQRQLEMLRQINRWTEYICVANWPRNSPLFKLIVK